VIVDHAAPDWVARIREATGGRGAGITLDTVSGDIGTQALEATTDGRRSAPHGFTSGRWTPWTRTRSGGAASPSSARSASPSPGPPSSS